jgi:hypothetical protein
VLSQHDHSEGHSNSIRASLGVQKPEGFRELKSPPYSKLNEDEILAPLIPSGFVAPKLALRCFNGYNIIFYI